MVIYLLKKEHALLMDILGHVNYDADESETYWSMFEKCKNLK